MHYGMLYNHLHVHVATSEINVIRKLRKRMKPGFRRQHRHRNARHNAIRAVLKEHLNAGALYNDVMSGRIGSGLTQIDAP